MILFFCFCYETDYAYDRYDPDVPASEVCPTVYQPMCGSDGVTYSNLCFMAVAGAAPEKYRGVCKTGIYYVLKGACSEFSIFVKFSGLVSNENLKEGMLYVQYNVFIFWMILAYSTTPEYPKMGQWNIFQKLLNIFLITHVEFYS